MKRLIEAIKAWFRGERRTAPTGVRGRVYARKGGSGGPLAAVAKFKPTMKLRVWREQEQRWEDGPKVRT